MANRVHLAGLALVIEGLPFQQQDQGVGACATTALWSALAKVMRTDGQRPPTPLAITAAATEQRVQARAFPAVAGLDLDQMAMAIHATGYQPHVFLQISGEAEIFVLALKCYLRSGIPVIVRVRIEGELHAMTLAGFRDCATLGTDDIAIHFGQRVQRVLRSRGVARWYVHDDRLGPYARIGFEQKEGKILHHRLQLLPLTDGFEDFQKTMTFSDALVPLYPKLRLTAEELVALACDILPRIAFLARMSDDEMSDDELYVEPRFWLGGDYLAELYNRPIAPERIIELATTMLLSRYVGILSWWRGDDWICDVVYDTTDVRRDMRSAPPILGIIPRDEGWLESIERLRGATLGPRPVIG